MSHVSPLHCAVVAATLLAATSAIASTGVSRIDVTDGERAMEMPMASILPFATRIAPAGNGAPGALFFADFGTGCSTGSVPTGFIVHDVDQRIPAPNVNYLGASWTRYIDFRHGDDCVVMSTSYFDPVGSADDWLVIEDALTPAVGTVLRWNAVAYHASYPDGYEVRYSTGGMTPADFLANPPLLTVDEEASVWTSHSLPLYALAGTAVHLAFRNASDDKYVLALDDIYVGPVPSADPAVTGVIDAAGYRYTVVPDFLGVPFEFAIDVGNGGTAQLSGIDVHARVMVDGVTHGAPSVAPDAAALAPGQAATVPLGSGIYDTLGVWSVEASVSASEGDGDPGNSSRSTRLATVTEDTLVHADPSGSGYTFTEPGGYYGVDFDLPGPARLSALTVTAYAATDTTLHAEIYRFDPATGKEIEWVAAAEVDVTGDPSSVQTITVPVYPVGTGLPAGHYIVALEDLPDRTLVLRRGQTTGNTWQWDVWGWVRYDLAVPAAAGFEIDLGLVLAAPRLQPEAVDDAWSLRRGVTLVQDVAENDLPADATENTWTVGAQPLHGVLQMLPDGSFTYTHDGSAPASDSFTYTLCDADAECDTATVQLTIVSTTVFGDGFE